MRRWAFLMALSASAGASASESASTFEWLQPSGKISHGVSVYSQPVRELEDYEQRLEGEMEFGVRAGGFGLKATPWLWTHVPGTLKSDAHVELKEAWFEYFGEDWDVRAGNQILSWGAADQVNPTDNWNPRDFEDPFQSRKLPVTLAKLGLHPAAIEWASLELVATPFFRENRLPTEFNRSRWLLSVPRSVVSGEKFSAPLRYRLEDSSYPESWQAGGRLKLLGFSGWDFSVSVFDGVESAPRYAATYKGSARDAKLPVDVRLYPSYHRQRVYGFDGAGAFSLGSIDLGARFEAAYFDHANDRAASAPSELRSQLERSDEVVAVAGMDHTFERKILWTVMYVNFQYVHREELGRASAPAGVVGLPSTLPWDRNLVLYFENRVGDGLKLSNELVGSLARRDFLYAPRIEYAWTDSLRTALGAEIFGGTRKHQGFFSQFKDDSRATFTASLVF